MWAPLLLVLASFLPHFPLVTMDMVANKSQLQHQSCSGFLIPSASPMGLVFSKDGRELRYKSGFSLGTCDRGLCKE